MKAIEFFSGIGAFHEAARDFNVQVLAAFDQHDKANRSYEENFGLRPTARNLDTIAGKEIPAADLWWLSPPCTPFSVRGRKKDDADPRARAFINLIGIIPEALPRAILLENVQGFSGSRVHARLIETLTECGYASREYDICPTQFGVPMRRPRHFVVALREGAQFTDNATNGAERRESLSSYLRDWLDKALTVDDETLTRYAPVLNIVDPESPDATLICFTSGYYRCRKASGSLIKAPDGQVRRVSPSEILRLLGFRADFHFPDDIDLPGQWRLVGNSVDVRSVRHLLDKIALT